MMFTVTVRLKDGGFEGEKILLFKFLAMLSAPPLHSGSYLRKTQKFPPGTVIGFSASGLLLKVLCVAF